MRTAVDFRSGGKECYREFLSLHPSSTLTYLQWQRVIYGFNEAFRDHILQTGEKCKFPGGIGEFTVNKKKRKKVVSDGTRQWINLPIDWPKTLKEGKRIYNFNFHTEGYFFGWLWVKRTAIIRLSQLWWFTPCRTTKRLLAHYLKSDPQTQYLYQEWNLK